MDQLMGLSTCTVARCGGEVREYISDDCGGFARCGTCKTLWDASGDVFPGKAVYKAGAGLRYSAPDAPAPCLGFAAADDLLSDEKEVA